MSEKNNGAQTACDLAQVSAIKLMSFPESGHPHAIKLSFASEKKTRRNPDPPPPPEPLVINFCVRVCEFMCTRVRKTPQIGASGVTMKVETVIMSSVSQCCRRTADQGGAKGASPPGCCRMGSSRKETLQVACQE